MFTAAYLAGILYGFSKVQQILGITALRWLEAAKAPFIASVVAGIAAWLISNGLGQPTWSTLAFTGGMLGCAYGLSVFLLDRSMYSELRAILAKARYRGED